MAGRQVFQTVASVALAVVFVAGGVFVAGQLASSKPELPKSRQSKVATIYSRSVRNGPVPVQIEATGSLRALNRLDLFSEVQGAMLPDGGRFRSGSDFEEGELLIGINAADFEASLMAQRSELQKLITAALADIRMDFPASFDAWNEHASTFDVRKPLAELPDPATDQEKMFLTSRNIISSYYSIRNAEQVLKKYRLTAPYAGVLVESFVTPGTVVRPGQKLGTFIDPTMFEMETPIPVDAVQYLKVGQPIELSSSGNGQQTWSGKIARINSLVDAGSQTLNAYLLVSGEGLEEGMFLEATIAATEFEDAIELPREMLLAGNLVYVKDGDSLGQREVEPIFFTEQTVIIRGLKNGESVLTKMPPSAYPGMKVRTGS